MKGLRILVAEDDVNIRNGLMDTLASEGYDPVPASDGGQALALFRNDHFGLVLLDIMMPRKSGYDVCREIRAVNPAIPIIILTAKGEEIDKVVGLQLGADDYVTKPFGVHELLARIAAVLRRSQPGRETAGTPELAAVPERFVFGRAEIDTREYRARDAVGAVEDLTAKEVQLLRYFHAHADEVLSRDALLNAVWGQQYFGTTRTLDQHIAQLRKKVETDPAQPGVIETIHGVGYRYNP